MLRAGPKKWVTGANGRLRASTDVLAIMLMPSGTFSRSLKSGLAPWKTTRSPCARAKRKKPWSSSLLARMRPPGLTQSWISTRVARAR
jgi:hypothetical protein